MSRNSIVLIMVINEQNILIVQMDSFLLRTHSLYSPEPIVNGPMFKNKNKYLA